MVFVIDTDKILLAPCHPAKARKLLKAGKAAVWRVAPFTIILKKTVSSDAPADIRLKIDCGSRHTGLSILRGGTVQISDLIKASIPKGKKKGVWRGRVLCRSSGSFDIKVGSRRIQGVSHKYCGIIQKSDGYQYYAERKTPLSSP